MTSAVLLSLCILAIHGAALTSTTHPDEVYYFKVYTQEDPAYIRQRLHCIDVRHIFKMSGHDLYYILVSNDQSRALGRLNFPRSTKVIQLPVGPVCQFLVNFNVAGCQPMNAERVDFDASNLTFVEFKIRSTGSFDLAGLGEMLKAVGEVYTPAIEKVKSEVYYLIGRFPPRIFMFLNGGRDQVEQMVESRLRTTGGGRDKVEVVYKQMTEVPGSHRPPPHLWSQH